MVYHLARMPSYSMTGEKSLPLGSNLSCVTFNKWPNLTEFLFSEKES